MALGGNRGHFAAFHTFENPRIHPRKPDLWYNKTMKLNRIISVVSIIGLAVLILMLVLTSPIEIGPFGVLLFFTTVYVVAFGIITKLMQLFYRLALRRDTFRHKDYLYAAVLAFTPLMFLMARSFGVVNLWTTLLIFFCVFLAEFLVAKRS